MTSEEKNAVFTSLGVILASLRQIEMNVDAATDALAQTVPAFHAEFQKALASKRTHVVNDLDTTLEYLRRTLLKNTQ